MRVAALPHTPRRVQPRFLSKNLEQVGGQLDVGACYKGTNKTSVAKHTYYDYDSMIIIWSHEVETNATILILTYCTNII